MKTDRVNQLPILLREIGKKGSIIMKCNGVRLQKI